MSESVTNDNTQHLIEEVDARLREAERLRREAEQRRTQKPFWPDRRRVGHVRNERA